MMRSRLFSATATLLLLLTALQAWSLLRAPAAWFPAAIEVRLDRGETITLGTRDLAAPSADRAHLQLRRDAGGAWLLRNLSTGRPVILYSGDDEQRMGSAPLAGLRQFQIGATVFAAPPQNGGRARFGASDTQFSFGGGTWRYDGATLYRNGQALPSCPDAHAASQLVALWNRAVPRAWTVARPLIFGGNLHCGNRLGLPGVDPGAAILARRAGQLQLSAGNQDGGHTALRITGIASSSPAIPDSIASINPQPADLRQQEQPLAEITAFSVGRTRYQIAPDTAGSSIKLLPARHVALFTAPDARLGPHLGWQWQQRELWNLRPAPLVLALLAVAIFALAIAGAAQGRGADAVPPAQGSTSASSSGASPRTARVQGTWGVVRNGTMAATDPTAMALASAALLAAGVAAVLAQRGGQPASAACSLLLGAAGLALWLIAPKRLPLPVAAALVLLAAGLLAQLELGLGAGESSWLRYYQKSTALLAAGSGAGGLWHCWNRTARGITPQRTIEWLLAIVAAAALAALAAQVLWGDETGVFDLQPVELAKLALTALTAHCLALRMGWNDPGYRQHGQAARLLQLAAPALLFLFLLGLALIQVDDYSPLILLLVWSLSMAFSYAMAAHKRAMAAGLAAMALAAVAGIAMVRGAGADGMAQWPLAGGFYADRFQVWLAPSAHPHTGQQLLLGARAIADGGWLGADSMLGLRSLGMSAGGAVNIPAVQDDFAPSFFLNRHGLLGAMLLWAGQAALVAGMLHLAGRACAAAAQARDFRHAWLGRFRYFALCGGAAFVLGHLLLSWGTNLAIFPIMGQPMSFLSAGGSHLLFFLCPLLAFCAVSAQSLEENLSCRSTSNTKS
ncbi:FtsW/RodA/SpoVE family cell cycle protein [Pseudoduganella sp. LjRoot289]|uniref:FtsW/RodA/SpoVE family cell cycle protein n=1 Tax=Pseudoduganella sp. LjRoot289 TaxID=3342314 RepID=UPI003ECD8C94